MELVLWANNLVRDDEKATVMQRAVVVQGRRRAALRSYRVCGVLVLSQGSVVVCVGSPSGDAARESSADRRHSSDR